MQSRQQRREAERKALKQGILRKSEVFTFTDQSGAEQWLEVAPLRQWVEKNVALVGVDIDIAKVEDMLSNGRIDMDHVTNVTLLAHPKPIIVCADFADGRDEIVDGNHTYVAMALARAKSDEMGFEIAHKFLAPAYVVERKDWTQFLVPLENRPAKL